MEQLNYMVRVSCMTYNHAPYITDALNGFCMQQTTFPFVCTIIDDASTDGEQEVLKQYFQEHFDIEDKSIARNEESDDYVLTFARHKTNKNCFFAVLYLKYNHYSIGKTKGEYIKEWSHTKYVALCEGDDYWIYDKKLQEQVNALQINPHAVMSYSLFKTVDNNGKIILRPSYEKYKRISASGDMFCMLFNGNFILTLTVLIRNNVYQSPLYNALPIRYDYSLFLTAAAMGDLIFIDKETGCYRETPTGFMHTKKDWVKRWRKETLFFFINEFIKGGNNIIYRIPDKSIKIVMAKHIVEYRQISILPLLMKNDKQTLGLCFRYAIKIVLHSFTNRAKLIITHKVQKVSSL